jgi:deoxyadenosine/deoxycytidine kinase
MGRKGKEQEPGSKDLRIGIVGPMGVGKSTLAGLLLDQFGPEVITESFQQNPFLAGFYKEPRRYSFKSQMWFLVDKVKALSGYSPRGGIIDPTLEMDKAYAEAQYRLGMMNEAEWDLYCMLFETLSSVSTVPSPDLFVSVKAPAEVLQQRIRTRGRVYELWMLENYPEYLDKLIEVVADWEKEVGNRRPIVVVDSQRYNFVTSGYDQVNVLAQINQAVRINSL